MAKRYIAVKGFEDSNYYVISINVSDTDGTIPSVTTSSESGKVICNAGPLSNLANTIALQMSYTA